MKENLYILFHNINSVNLIIQFTRITLGFDVENLIISKAEGSAAMSGIPTAQRAVYKRQKNLLYLKDISDVIDLINPEKIFFVVPKKYTDNFLEKTKINDPIKQDKKVVIAFSGQKIGFSKKEMDLGIPIALDLPHDVGPLGSLAIILNHVLKNQ